MEKIRVLFSPQGKYFVKPLFLYVAMVHFRCLSLWAKGCPDIWSTFVDMSVRGFPEEINLQIGGLNKADRPPINAGEHHPTGCGPA